MATLDAAAIELADSLPIESVPAKLRCGQCNKLIINAVKLPCCDQNICEPCSQDLPDTCPICSHSPLSAEDSKPNKSLRMTVKAFIKNEEKRRAKESESQAAQAKDSATPVPGDVQAAAMTDADTSVHSHSEVNGHAAVVPASMSAHVDDAGQPDASEAVDASRDVSGIVQTALVDGDADVDEEEEDEDDDVVITTERPDNEVQDEVKHEEQQQYDQDEQVQDQSQTNGQQGFGFDQNQNFSNMDFSNMNNFNPMMAAMQGGMGMPNFGMGMPNMMGMTGMNMDPSIMFGGGFGGGMGGMHDMSSMMGMGMGMNGMGNFGGMTGMGMGGGPGFFPPNGGGYNQQNFGNHMNPNFHHNRGYTGRPYNRGFGRGGRGHYGRGRGGWQNYGQYSHGQNQNNHNFMNQQHQQQQQNFRGNSEGFDSISPQAAGRGSPSYEPMNATDGPADDSSQQKHVADGEHEGDLDPSEANATNNTEDGTANAQDDIPTHNIPDQQTEEGSGDITTDYDVGNNTGVHATTGAALEYPAEDELLKNAVRADSAASHGMLHDYNNPDPYFQQGYGYGARGGRGGFRGARGGFRGQSAAYGHVSTLTERETAPAPAPPINAPTGPKAMRAGLPNSGWYSRPQQPAAPAAPAQSESGRSRDIEAEPRSRTRSRSPSRSRVEERYEKRRPSDVHEESEESYERRKDRERRKRKEREGRYDSREEDHDDNEPRKKTRSRSESRDEGHSKRRSRDDEDQRRTSRSHRDRSHDRRKHRHRSRSPGKDADVNGDEYDSSRRKHRSERRHEEEYSESDRTKERSHRRSSRRDDDYDKDRSNDSSRHGRRTSRAERDRDDDRETHRSVAVVEEPEEEFEFKIKGKSASMSQGQGFDGSMGPPPAAPARDRSERRSSVHATTPAVTPTTPFVDPYEAERASHRKKREAEQQKKLEGRRQSSHGLGKHGRDDEELDAPTGPRADGGRSGKRMARKDLRRHSFKYEGEVGQGVDEREGGRWR